MTGADIFITTIQRAIFFLVACLISMSYGEKILANQEIIINITTKILAHN